MKAEKVQPVEKAQPEQTSFDLLEEARAKAQKKADELTEKLKVLVTPLVFRELNNPTAFVVGYLREPDRLTKLRIMDNAVMGAFSAASNLLPVLLIREESDPRILSEAQENDSYYIGAVTALQGLTQVALDQFKKK